MTDEQAKRACGYMGGQLSAKNCSNCQRATISSNPAVDHRCSEHNGMPVSYFGVCRDWKAWEVQPCPR